MIRLDESQRAALERLLEVAYRDTGQSRRVSDFLLSWWNANECGGFDMTDLWGLDTSLMCDVLVIIVAIAKLQAYPDTLGYELQFNRLIRTWRPQLLRLAAQEP